MLAKGLCRGCYNLLHPTKNFKPASCHPGQKHFAKGFCEECYTKQRYIPRPKIIKETVCHKERKHFSKGLCKKCYHAKYFNKWIQIPGKKTKMYLDKIKWRKTRTMSRRNINRVQAMKSKMKNKYGITLKDYNTLYINQNGICPICKTKKKHIFSKVDKADKLCIDHDHITLEIRGLLCSTCNINLAVVENSDFVNNAYNYLRKMKIKEAA